MPKNSYFKEVDNKDVFVMSDFDKNYKFKGFQEEQFKKISNKYTGFIYQHRKTWYFNAEMKGDSAVVFRPEC